MVKNEKIIYIEALKDKKRSIIIEEDSVVIEVIDQDSKDLDKFKTNIIIADNINVEYVYLFNKTVTSPIVEDREIKLGINTQLKNYYCYLGNNFTVTLKQQLDSYSCLEHNVVFLADQKNNLNIQSKNNFIYPNAKGVFTIQGIVKNQARAGYYSSIIIDRVAKDVNARLEMSAINLSKEAKISLVPALKVATNQVKASHSAQISNLSKKQLFYLNSRGIDKIQVRKLLIQSVFQSFLDKLPNEDIKNKIESLLLKRLLPS